MASINNGVRGLGRAALPAAGAALGGTAIRAPSMGQGGAQHATLPARAGARPPGGGGNGATALRVGLAKISHDIMSRMVGGGAKAETVEGPHQVPTSVVLRGVYSAEARSRASSTAVNGWAALQRDFPGRV